MGESQGREWRIEVFVEIQKKIFFFNYFFFLGGGGWVGSGGSGWVGQGGCERIIEGFV